MPMPDALWVRLNLCQKPQVERMLRLLNYITKHLYQDARAFKVKAEQRPVALPQLNVALDRLRELALEDDYFVLREKEVIRLRPVYSVVQVLVMEPAGVLNKAFEHTLEITGVPGLVTEALLLCFRVRLRTKVGIVHQFHPLELPECSHFGLPEQ